MDFNGFNFEEFMKATQKSQENNNSNNNNNNNNNQNEQTNNCSDIPGGFQDLNPNFFAFMADILGAVMAENLPFNVQNAIGNWLVLVGQVLITYNSQQQYFQAGPGRYYNLNFKNVDNPFCQTSNNTNTTTQTSNDTQNSSPTQEDLLQKTLKNYENEINKLKKNMEDLKNQIEKLKENTQK